MLGTPAYMAPEQAAGDPPTVAQDVYALDAACGRALDTDPAARYPTAAALADALGRVGGTG
ncbi:MAG TPA: hypothetical protein VH092_33685 [Urbifossiella sp.]|nr:hypothetical protein [Urbifossiella sp.]